MTPTSAVALVRKIAGEAGPASRSRPTRPRQGTEVKVFGGEVESLAAENIEGVGVRVVVDGRQGFAWAGSLDPEVVAETLAEARDNAGFGTPDEYLGLPGPDEAAAPDRPGVAGPVARGAAGDAGRRQGGPGPRAGADGLAADARIRGVRTVSYGDGATEMALANSLGVEATVPAHGLFRLGV